MHIGEVMEKNRKTVTTSDDLRQALKIMRADGLEVMPVVGHDGNVVGQVWRSKLEDLLSDDTLDEAIEETFPASDPISPA